MRSGVQPFICFSVSVMAWVSAPAARESLVVDVELCFAAQCRAEEDCVAFRR